MTMRVPLVRLLTPVQAFSYRSAGQRQDTGALQAAPGSWRAVLIA